MRVNDEGSIKLVEYSQAYAAATVAMWRTSKQRALGIPEIHSFENHLYFLNEVLVQDNAIHLAIQSDTDRVVGIMATDGSYLGQLYIHVDYQRRGIGSRLLDLAKHLSSGKLQLHTFEVNREARAFYEAHGFEIIGGGSENEEQLPDILYEWRESNWPGN